ncbi:phosphonate ABC transporter ATP-binding protein [Burkholderia cenocepacia]|uniref:phosphonate ABC transporter ATP-binding protein n=2 Tax=Burkholderiales TaxID=80840 RepID=UPI001B9AEF78|nr:phosphonate ABC transporter ATP-binding protein [Burkholderia cenocepacia]MBR8289697.1 phosphonate ABC transporter ATP-binding protein [Burkholderia cenocepacia]
MKLEKDRDVLSLKGVSVRYVDSTVALHPTSLDVKQGEFLVLLGASGAGKSTLLRSINGLVLPTKGEVSIPGLAGGVVNAKTLREHRKRCGMVFQQHHLIGRQSVLRNVLMGKLGDRGAFASLWPWSKKDKLEALTVIERVGLLEKALSRADALSGGQQQRVGIARALIQKPRILLADEPVASLDPATAHSVLTLLHEICKKDHLTAIVSLHQVELARSFADRIIGLRQGAVVFEGRAEQLRFEGRAEQLSPDVARNLYAKQSNASNTSASTDSPRTLQSSQTKELLPC